MSAQLEAARDAYMRALVDQKLAGSLPFGIDLARSVVVLFDGPMPAIIASSHAEAAKMLAAAGFAEGSSGLEEIARNRGEQEIAVVVVFEFGGKRSCAYASLPLSTTRPAPPLVSRPRGPMC